MDLVPSSTTSCELSQKSQIVLGKEPDVGNNKQNHGQPIHAETKSDAGPLLGVVGTIAASSFYLIWRLTQPPYN
jgi:hypothetical protein